MRCDCCSQLRDRPTLPQYGSDLGTLDPAVVNICKKQTSNFKGHSYLSCFLLFGLGGWIYKRHPHVVDELVSELVKSLRSLFDQGVETSHGRVYAALIGVKGDMDFHKKI